MKSDRDFLDGIYQKVEKLSNEKTVKKEIKESKAMEKEKQIIGIREIKQIKENKNAYKYIIRYSSLAAIFIILPLLFFAQEIWNPSVDITQPEPRVMSINQTEDKFIASEYIILGQTSEILNGLENSEFIEVTIIIEKLFKGEIIDNNIRLTIPQDMKSQFEEGEKSVLFLYKEQNGEYRLYDEWNSKLDRLEKNTFVDNEENTYTIKDIENKIKGED